MFIQHLTRLRSLKSISVKMVKIFSIIKFIKNSKPVLRLCYSDSTSETILKSQRSFSVDTAGLRRFPLDVIKRNYGNKKKSDSAQFEFEPYKLYNIPDPPPSSTTCTAEEAMKLFETMYTIRRMEMECANLYKAKMIRGFCHLYSGEEAVAVGIKSAMREQDTCITAYRCHGWTFLFGGTPYGVIAELAGRISGVSRGKGGSMHMYAPKFYGGNGIVGAQVPLGAGLAFAHKYKGDKGIAWTLYGDGAANQGQVFEAFNIAKLWNLPVVFVCENNKYAMGTSTSRSTANTDFYKRGDYIPGIWVDGMDVLAVREVSRYAVDWCMADKGPLIVETETYRYFGHSMSDPGTSYRTREEVAEVRNTRDAITLFKNRILESNFATEKELKEIEKKIRTETQAQAKKVMQDPNPGLEELTTDVYVSAKTFKGEEIRGIIPSEPHKHIELVPRN